MTDPLHADAAVVGGGAAGCFAAAVLGQARPGTRILVLEKTDKLLGKVRASGGGRCNVTHNCPSAAIFSKKYPRGGKELKAAFATFGMPETAAWFARQGVRLITEADGRMFPDTHSSETIVQALLGAGRKAGALFRTKAHVVGIRPMPEDDQGYELRLADGARCRARCVLVAPGGLPKPSQYAWLEALALAVVPPVPSLFTFNVPDSPLAGLQGLAVADAELRLVGARGRFRGPLLVTHWGLSGPAVLQASAWEARWLSSRQYAAQARVAWLPGASAQQAEAWLQRQRAAGPSRLVQNTPPEALPRRLWERLCALAQVPQACRSDALPRKAQNRLAELLMQTPFAVAGKTTHKDEFVTAGGIALSQIDFRTMEATNLPGLHIAGEVLDVDGITGGFNFQAAWTTGWLAAMAMARRLG